MTDLYIRGVFLCSINCDFVLLVFFFIYSQCCSIVMRCAFKVQWHFPWGTCCDCYGTSGQSHAFIKRFTY